MREVKFRVWDPEQEQFLSPAELSSCELRFNGRLYRSDNSPPFNAFEDEAIFQQYTGLKDKNGKEIYEGDIVVEHERKYGTDEIVKTHPPVEVKWSFSYKPGFDVPNQIQNCIEVIGNIYENPELLK